MTKFLRFEIAGASTIFWILLFISPHLNMVELVNVDATKLLSTIIGSIILAVPLGNYIHQGVDVICNPFAAVRLFIYDRAVIATLKEVCGDSASDFSDKTFQAILVFSKSVDIEIDEVCATNEERKYISKFIASTLREEIYNRYSYYYARVENGVFAPILGYLLSYLVLNLGLQTKFFTPVPLFSSNWIIIAAMLLGILLVWRIPQLFRELDDLEVALVKLQRPFWEKNILWK